MNNLFASLNPPAHSERFDTLLAHRNLVIERIVSSADIAPVDYVQEQGEWVLLLRAGVLWLAIHLHPDAGAADAPAEDSIR